LQRLPLAGPALTVQPVQLGLHIDPSRFVHIQCEDGLEVICSVSLEKPSVPVRISLSTLAMSDGKVYFSRLRQGTHNVPCHKQGLLCRVPMMLAVVLRAWSCHPGHPYWSHWSIHRGLHMVRGEPFCSRCVQPGWLRAWALLGWSSAVLSARHRATSEVASL